MRAAIVSDIHGNFHAFERCIADAMSFGGIDEIWCVGDIVGYGPDPNACVRELIDARYLGTDVVAIAGNHDRAATGGLSTASFNPAARRAAQWTTDALDARAYNFLERLPEVATAGPHHTFSLVHGSVRDPMWEYVTHPLDVLDTLNLVETAHAIVGHTHVPMLYELTPDMALSGSTPVGLHFEDGVAIELNPVARYLLNPGSVGQPRDGDWRASYALYDHRDDGREWIQLRRVAYPVDDVQATMRAAGLPENLALRLSYGR